MNRCCVCAYKFSVVVRRSSHFFLAQYIILRQDLNIIYMFICSYAFCAKLEFKVCLPILSYLLRVVKIIYK